MRSGLQRRRAGGKRRRARRPRARPRECARPLGPRSAAACRRSSAGAGYAEAAVAGVGGGVEDALAGPAGPRLVGAQHVLELDHVARGLDAVEIELLDLLDVIE